MQKLGEMYKYPQSGMMNPGMMNAVMNSGENVRTDFNDSIDHIHMY